jgi:peptide/nickel transport system ATP-binding protein
VRNDDLISIENLSLIYNSRTGPVKAVKDVSWKIRRGEIIGVCGESGSGKTAAALALMGLLPSSAAITDGKIIYEGKNLLEMPESKLRAIRGTRIAMIFQDAAASLNPSLTIGGQICEALIVKQKFSRQAARQKAIELLASAGISSPETCLDKYPHQLSGGMQQRAIIAMAISCEPDVLIADEPMSALDSALQLQIRQVFADLNKNYKTAIMLISHDLRSVSEICDRTYIMYGGYVIESGSSAMLERQPRHPYTKALLECIPAAEKAGKALTTINGSLDEYQSGFEGCIFYPRCSRRMTVCAHKKPPVSDLGKEHQAACWLFGKEMPDIKVNPDFKANSDDSNNHEPYNLSSASKDRNLKDFFPDEKLLAVDELTVSFRKKSSALDNGVVKAVKNVSFSIGRGESFGLIGESGCGKTTLARTIMGLYIPENGNVFYSGADLSLRQNNLQRRKMQYIFQNPYSSLDPRMTVDAIISEALDIFKILPQTDERMVFLRKILKMTGLNENYLYRYPHEFSGGQRQRVAIARSLVSQPELIILDEPVSSLDVSVQAQILNLLTELRQKLNLTYLFISHDLPVIRHISNRTGVMFSGRLIEICSTTELFSRPLHPYTHSLFAASSDPDIKEIAFSADKSRQRNKTRIIEKNKSGSSSLCEYSGLCPYRSQLCLESEPPMLEIKPGHYVRCHFGAEIMI